MGGFLELTFIRHGLTTYNEQRRYIGSTDLPLSTRGRASIQQQQLQPNTIIITSDLRRSIETASILYPNEEITPLSSIREMDFGKWEGKTYDELKHNHAYRKWVTNPEKITPPGGESVQHFKKRTIKGMDEIIHIVEKNDVSKAIIVTHGGVIRQWLVEFAPVKKSFFEWDVPIGCAYVLVGTKENIRRGFRFTSLQEERITGKTNGQLLMRKKENDRSNL